MLTATSASSGAWSSDIALNNITASTANLTNVVGNGSGLTNIPAATGLTGVLPPAQMATNAAAASKVLTATSPTTASWSDPSTSPSGFVLSSSFSGNIITMGSGNVRYFAPFPTIYNSASASFLPAAGRVPVSAPFTLTNFIYGTYFGCILETTNLVWRVYTNGVSAGTLNTQLGANTAGQIFTNDLSFSVTVPGTDWTNLVSIQISNASSAVITIYPTCQFQIVK